MLKVRIFNRCNIFATEDTNLEDLIGPRREFGNRSFQVFETLVDDLFCPNDFGNFLRRARMCNELCSGCQIYTVNMRMPVFWYVSTATPVETTVTYVISGAQLVKKTLFAPASLAMTTISRLVVPRTMLSSTIRMFLPANFLGMGLSFALTPF